MEGDSPTEHCKTREMTDQVTGTAHSMHHDSNKTVFVERSPWV